MEVKRYWVSTANLKDKASIVASDSVVYGADYDAVDQALAMAQSIIARQDVDLARLTKGLRSIMDSGCDYDIDIARRALRSSVNGREVEFPCGHTVAHEEDCPRCEIDRLRSPASGEEPGMDRLGHAYGTGPQKRSGEVG